MADSTWTPELKKQVVDEYLASDPTPENTMDIVKDIAENVGKTAHGVRMILTKEGEYIKKTPAASGSGSGTSNSDKPKRVSKQDSIDALDALLESQAVVVDKTITSKLTGKAAIWFKEVINQIVG